MKFNLTNLNMIKYEICRKIDYKNFDHFSRWAFGKSFLRINDVKDIVNGWNGGGHEFKILPGSENRFDLDKMINIYKRKFKS